VSDELKLRNIDAIAAFHMRWRLQGGSFHWQARPMSDLRDQEQLRQWRLIEHKRRATGLSKRAQKVVNIAKWQLRRLRNGKERVSA
jgi:hypothetical protein